jgi:serine/threonine protein phosphatase PrpC
VARLPNASVGKPYRQSIREVLGSNADNVGRIALSVPAGSGLIFDDANQILQGTPEKPGELQLTLDNYPAHGAAEQSARKHLLVLTINPNPESLWKNVKSDQAGLFAKPDEEERWMETPELMALAASLRGRSHAHEGKYRDDDFAMAYVETGWHIFVVADGAGSAKYSRRGSQIACGTATEVLKNKLATENQLDAALEKFASSNTEDHLEKLRKIACNLLVQPAYEAFMKIRQEAEYQQATLRDFATTFILVIAKKLRKRWFVASFAIGDGGAGAMLSAERVKLLTRPDSGEFAGQTVFLTTPQLFKDTEALLSRTQTAFFDEFKLLAVMTDGITDPIFESDAKFGSATAWESWRQGLSKEMNLEEPEPEMGQALLDYLHFPSPGNHDDRTLIVAVPVRSHGGLLGFIQGTRTKKKGRGRGSDHHRWTNPQS